MVEIIESQANVGVKFAQLKVWADDRGKFLETFRQEWFPERSWNVVQTNCSYSRAGVLRGLHYHHNQVDYWFVPQGTIRVGLADLRPGSPTLGASQTLEIGENNRIGVFVPVGVAHGFLTLTDAVLTYLVDNYYDGADELGVAWNDPDLSVDWGTSDPYLSDRDRNNPWFKDLPASRLPRPYTP